ncbi:hypothetical protein GN956_G12282 [Arapaima gigas]
MGGGELVYLRLWPHLLPSLPAQGLVTCIILTVIILSSSLPLREGRKALISGSQQVYKQAYVYYVFLMTCKYI